MGSPGPEVGRRYRRGKAAAPGCLDWRGDRWEDFGLVIASESFSSGVVVLVGVVRVKLSCAVVPE